MADSDSRSPDVAPHGRIVLGTPTGDRHGFATAILADPDEAAGGIAVSVNVGDEIVSGTIDAIRTAGAVRVLSGGRAIADAVYARRLGADAYSDINALAWFDAMNTTP